MQCVLLAESAVLVHFETIGIVLLVLHCIVVSLFAFCASKCYFYSHVDSPLFTSNFKLFRSFYSLIIIKSPIYYKSALCQCQQSFLLFYNSFGSFLLNFSIFSPVVRLSVSSSLLTLTSTKIPSPV